MAKQTKVLLTFDTKRAAGIRQSAEIAAAKLNELHEVFPFTSKEEHSEIFSNPRETFNDLWRKADPKVAEMEQYIDINEMKLPADAELQRKFKALGLAGGSPPWSNFNGVTYDESLDKWVVDEAAVEARIDDDFSVQKGASMYDDPIRIRCRTYAETPEQLKRLAISKAMCEWLNEEGAARTHDDTRQKFEGMLRYDANRRDPWSINPDWILASIDAPIEYQATKPRGPEYELQCRGIFD